jgi:hypothetical protein
MSKKTKTKTVIITSKYDGTCNKCKKTISPGQIIRWNPDKRSAQHVICHPKRKKEKINPKKVKEFCKNKEIVENRLIRIEQEEKNKEKEELKKNRLLKYQLMSSGFLSAKNSIRFLEIDENLFNSLRTRTDFPKPVIINKELFWKNDELKIFKEKFERSIKNE